MWRRPSCGRRRTACRYRSLDVVGFHGQTITHRPGEALHLADRRRRRARAGAGRARGQRPARRRRRGGRAGRAAGAGVPCRAGARAAAAARGGEYRRRRQRHLDRRGRCAAGLRYRAGQRADRRLVRASRRPALRSRRGARGFGQGRSHAARALGRASLLRAQAAEVARPRRLQRYLGRWPVGGRRRGNADPRHGACDLPGGAPFPGSRRSNGSSPAAARAIRRCSRRSLRRRARRSCRRRRWAGTAMRWRRRPSPSWRCARCAACRSPSRRRPARPQPLSGGRLHLPCT